MKRIILTVCLLAITFITAPSYSQNYSSNTMAEHPEWYIKVTDLNIYATWSAVAIIHHVTIENNSDIEYKNVKVRVCYNSMSTGGAGTIVSQEVGVLPVTLPPRSKQTYLSKGYTLGAGSMFMNAVDLQVLTATPVLN
ncbi:MAG: hypothetical protein ACE10J_05620 [Thermodesulfobacteriota bacterium]